jgi:hypothetical protein
MGARPSSFTTPKPKPAKKVWCYSLAEGIDVTVLNLSPEKSEYGVFELKKEDSVTVPVPAAKSGHGAPGPRKLQPVANLGESGSTRVQAEGTKISGTRKRS